jgi:large subunit ribosomal protein L10
MRREFGPRASMPEGRYFWDRRTRAPEGALVQPIRAWARVIRRRRRVDRANKEALVTSLNKALAETACVVVTHQTGMTVEEVTDLRRQMRAAGANFKVTKNRLARRALTGTKFERLSSMFIGPTAIAFSRDPVAAAKVAVEFANKNEKLRIIGGGLNDQQLDVAGVRSLATLPSLDELRARIIGMLQTPASRIAAVLQAPGGQIARVLGAYAKAGKAG